ncbi:MAG TPA: hypothetical protein VF916_10240, partial [Ktedonobacterales bacterium]
MGTTCVAVALVGGRGYFVNIGDSRGYIVRHGVMRQVTRDHSWVAEQVRAGVLTEEQARTHSHRNVITRSLGTQPDVSADLFIEDIQDGDHILLCSDGLHGYVAADEIQRVILEQDPESGVRQLVDLANANGGPDNITAVVVRLLEVPVEADTVPLPAVGMARKTRNLAEEATVPLRLDRSVGAPTTAAPVDEPVAAIAASVAIAGDRAKRAVWPVVGLRLLAVAALCLLAFGAWDLLAGPYADGRTANAQALRDVATAQSVAAAALSQNPDSALANLAAQQQQLRHDLATLALDATGRAKVQQALDGTIASAVQKVLDGYNTKFRIAALPASAVTPYSVSCGGETVASGPLAAVGAVPTGGSEATPPTLYAVTRSGALYAMSYGSGVATCGATPLVPAGVQAITSDATQLYALVQQGTAWAVLAVDASAPPAVKVALPADTPGTPVALAARGGDFYVVYQQASSLGSAILHFGGGDLKKPTQTIATPATVTALVASAAGSPFALLRDGTVVTWDAGGHVSVVAIALAQPVVSDDPSAYRGATPVPTFPPTATPAPVTPTPTPAPVSGSIVPATTATPTTAPATTATPGAPTSTPSTATATATSGVPSPTPAPTATPTGAVTVFGGSSSLATD